MKETNYCPEIRELLARMQRYGISRRALCERAERDHTIFTQYRNGANPNIATLRDLEAALDSLLTERCRPGQQHPEAGA